MVKYFLVVLIGCLAICGVIYLSPRIGDGRSPAATRSVTRAMKLMAAMKQYRSVYGVFPAEEFDQLTRVLSGQDIRHLNSKRLVFLELAKGMCDREGKLLDGWQRPFDISYTNGTQYLVIHSWGQNGKNEGGSNDDKIFCESLL